MITKPHLIKVPQVASKSGTLSFMEVDGTLPFDVKQLYWIYNIEGEAHRGNHAHVNTDRVIICISGVIDAFVESIQGERYEFLLNDPSNRTLLSQVALDKTKVPQWSCGRSCRIRRF